MEIRVHSFFSSISAIGKMLAHLTNFVRIWSLLVGLTKCAAHLGKRVAQLTKCARIWSTARAFCQRRAHLAKRAFNLPNISHLVKCRAFDQLVKCAAHLAKCADWSNAPYIYTLGGWMGGSVVERRSLTGELSLACTGPAADG